MKVTFQFQVTVEVDSSQFEAGSPRWRQSVKDSIEEFGAALTAFLESQPLVAGVRMKKTEQL